jgi:hypothetical protein
MVQIDEIIRRKRKTIALVIQPDGRLVVRAPQHATQAQIDAAVREHSQWIAKKRAQLRQTPPAPPPARFVEGERFRYLGQTYPLAIVERQRPALLFSDGFFMARRALPRAAQVFQAWYRAQAAGWIGARLGQLASLHGFRYQRVRISSARTRWGSCSPRGVLSFTWRLVLAPPDVIDYVIVHELAHLEINNHSAQFWARVKSLMPDYAQQRKWLKENAKALSLFSQEI